MNCTENGASWVRVDLHLHTPYSKSFTLSPGFNLKSKEHRQRFASRYVTSLKNAEIKLAAITDYNAINREWYEAIKNEAEKDEITVLPGVELSFNFGKYGLHVLLIFGKEVDVDGINRRIHSFDKYPEKSLATERDHRDIESEHDVLTVLKDIRQTYGTSCIIIYPHPKDAGGICKSLQVNQRVQYLKIADGIEYVSQIEIDKILSTGQLHKDFFHRFAIIENSDPKKLEEIGTKSRRNRTRSTFIKLGSSDVESLHFALHDPQVRVVLHKSPLHEFNCLEKIQIKGSTFLRDINFSFNPELNTLIGGRGVGKSALLESLRYVMDLPIYSEKSFRTDFVHAVVGSGGEITLKLSRYYGKQKKSFIIKRTIGKDTEIIDENDRRTGLTMDSLFHEGSFPIVIGQKELYHLSTSPSFQLQLIDQIIGEQVWKKAREFQQKIKRLQDNARKLLDMIQKLCQKEEYEQRLKNVESEIGVLRDLKVEEKLLRWTTVIEDDQRIKDSLQSIDQILEDTDIFFDEVISRLAGIVNNLNQGKSEHRQILKEMAGEIEAVYKVYNDTRKKLFDVLELNNKHVEDILQEWKARKEHVEGDIQVIKKDLGARGLNPDHLGELTRERTQLQSLHKDMRVLEKELNTLNEGREELRQELVECRLELFSLRQERVEEINTILNDRLRVKVQYEEDVISFLEALRNLLKGSNVTSDAISSLLKPKQKTVDGLLLSSYVRQGEQKLQEVFELTPKMAGRLVKWFEELERSYRLETLFPEDKIEIELNVNGEFKPIDKLSVGQKATALLLLLFAQEDRILILDQPEEDLDNRFIYEDVVKILREMKGKRQLIVATHNANIPVLGDSEQILSLEVKSERCTLQARGSVENMKAEIKSIMEGGEEAFRLRREKYGEG